MPVDSISKPQMETFLKHLANLRDRESVEQLKHRFPEFVPKFRLDSRPAKMFGEHLQRDWLLLPRKVDYWNASASKVMRALEKQISEEERYALARDPNGTIPWLLWLFLSVNLQKVWIAPHDPARDWRMWYFKNQVWECLSHDAEEPPIDPPAELLAIPLWRAVSHLGSGRRTCHCANPDCPSPYYFYDGRNAGNRKFCSKKCSVPSKRASKRSWWGRNRAK